MISQVLLVFCNNMEPNNLWEDCDSINNKENDFLDKVSTRSMVM
jgi:hypothetical protein